MMKLRRVVAGIVLLAPMLATSQSHAGASAGGCLATLRFDFAGQISNNSPPTTYTMSGSGTCQTSAGLAKTIRFNPTGGVASVARCLSLVMFGSYSVDFFPEGPSSSGGDFDFAGTASGGAVHMTGSMPTFVGAAAVAGGGLLGCGNGTNSLTFSIVLGFVDP